MASFVYGYPYTIVMKATTKLEAAKVKILKELGWDTAKTKAEKADADYIAWARERGAWGNKAAGATVGRCLVRIA